MFSTIEGPVRMHDFNDNVQMIISYEFKQDLRVISRKVYGFLDLLGDIGGLAGSLYSSFMLLIVVL